MQSWQSDLDHIKWMLKDSLTDFKGKNILDLGCGSGFLCRQFKEEQNANIVVGIDINPPENYTDSSPWKFINVNLDTKDWNKDLDNTFDFIFAFDILEHLASPFYFLSSCYNLLSKDGILVLTTPNTNSWERYAKPQSWSGVQDPQHTTLFNSYSLKFLLKKVGFSSNKVKAPVRKLSFLGPFQPNIGGQLYCLAEK